MYAYTCSLMKLDYVIWTDQFVKKIIMLTARMGNHLINLANNEVSICSQQKLTGKNIMNHSSKFGDVLSG